MWSHEVSEENLISSSRSSLPFPQTLVSCWCKAQNNPKRGSKCKPRRTNYDLLALSRPSFPCTSLVTSAANRLWARRFPGSSFCCSISLSTSPRGKKVNNFRYLQTKNIRTTYFRFRVNRAYEKHQSRSAFFTTYRSTLISGCRRKNW